MGITPASRTGRSDRLVLVLIGVITMGLFALIYGTVYPRLPGSAPADAGRITAADLLEKGADHAFLPVDTRHPDAFAQGHLAGAVNLPSSALREPGQDVLSSPEQVAAVLEDRGVDPSRPVVVYCDNLASAAYVAWTLVTLGHPRVYLLDGGIAAWKRAGGEIATGTDDAGASELAALPAGTWTDRVAAHWPQDRYLDAFDLYYALDDPDIVLVDARHAGERSAEIRPVHDHQDTYHVPWTSLIEEDGRTFRNRMALHRAVEVLPARRQIVVYADDPLHSALVWWTLYEQGYAHVTHFDETFTVWQEMNFPTQAVEEAGQMESPAARLGGGCG